MTPNEGLRVALSQARQQTDSLFDLVHPAALYERPIPERHRIIFYLGHLEAFDWNLLSGALDLPAFHAGFDQLFSFGIDPGSQDLPTDQPADWPAADEVRAYSARVRGGLHTALAQSPARLLHVAIEHRLMHAETFAYMLHHLPFAQKTPPASAAMAPSGPAPQMRMVEIPGGTATLGQKRDGGFGWDNEFEQHQVAVPAFSIAQYKVTNGDYLEFVKAGAAAPHFWTCRQGRWCYHGMFEDIPLPLDWPVYVSLDEAQAYARWKGMSLPTEAQFHRAAYHGGAEEAAAFALENVDFRSWDPEPVTASPRNALGVSQMVGNGWEWTATRFEPFAGFEPFPFYPGYSANFFDGQHYVLKGGSPRTAGCLLRPSFRNWFRPAYPYIYATFRLVEN
ncbi:MAG TPA: SUMF1/EgtB/PvdO family nonheme iron enzyme [Bryobacteraceae bacterium]|nr:SUMF1/EgtB/PvdO family nonheme iron enzyme [Bryobacteraceae bacterium]